MKSAGFLFLMLLAALGAAGRNDWLVEPRLVEAGAALVDTLPRCSMADVHVRALAKGECRWAVLWNYADSAHYAFASVAVPGGMPDEIYGSKCTVEAGVRDGDAPAVLAEALVDYSGGEFSLKVAYDGFSARLYAGEDMQQLVGRVPFDASAPGAVMLVADKPLLCRRLTAYATPLAPIERSAFGSMAELAQAISDHPGAPAGVWEYLDRDVREEKAALGGRYKLAVAKNADGAYDVIYLAGAEENADEWQPLAVKGRLRPTIFANNYDLEWRDAYGRALADDCNAQLSADGGVLELRFPLQGSTLRLRRCAQLHLALGTVE